jgi:hypothetical protein
MERAPHSRLPAAYTPLVGLERRVLRFHHLRNQRQTSNTMAATTKTTTPISTSTAMLMLVIVAKK